MRPAENYRALNPNLLIATISRLLSRVEERFPDRGISGVCQQLCELAPDVVQTATTLSKPNLLLRGAVFLVIAVGIALVARLFWLLELDGIDTEAFRFFEGLEALINVVILSGAGI